MDPWLAPDVVRWCRWLLDSHAALVGAPLLPLPDGDDVARAVALFEADLVVLSHDGGTGPEGPRLVYGNRAALALWEMRWDELVGMPSRRTAEPDRREERERALAEAARRGFFEGYQGVRISATGRRFAIEGARLWSVRDDEGRTVGQAAAFSTWTPLG